MAKRQLGAARIAHLDVDRRQVEWLTGQIAQRGLTGVTTEVADVTETLGTVPPLDLAVVFGVLHHLPAPDRFLRLLCDRMAPGGLILFRCYRANSFSRYLAGELRRFTSLLAVENVRRAAAEVFPGTSDPQFDLDLVDDLFVPVYRPLLPQQLLDDGEALDCAARLLDPSPAIDFGDRDENFRVRMDVGQRSTPTGASQLNAALSCAIPTDPRSLPFPSVEELAHAFDGFGGRVAGEPPEQVARRIVALYALGRRRKGVDPSVLLGAPENVPPAQHAALRVRALLRLLRA